VRKRFYVRNRDFEYLVSMFVALFLILVLLGVSKSTSIELSSGTKTQSFFTFCPCMGRIGNQLEHYLQAFDLSLRTGRILILPPFLDWNEKPVRFVSFDEMFDLEYLRSNGLPKALTFKMFMDLYSDTWTNRKAFCSPYGNKSCKEFGKLGVPGNYWERIGLEFDGGDVRKVLTASNANEMKEYDIIVMTTSKFSFPAPQSALRHHQMLKWSASISSKATQLIQENIPSSEPFVTVHIRAAIDFIRACSHDNTKRAFENANFRELKKFFEARTCFENGHNVSYRMCEPRQDDYVNAVQNALERTSSCHVFVASDLKPSKLSKLLSSKLLKPPSSRSDCSSVTLFSQQNSADPLVDLAVMAQGTHFIGNCVSSFTAIVARERRASARTTTYWGARLDREEVLFSNTATSADGSHNNDDEL